MTSSYQPYPGRFLISEPFMWDANFKRTVVLLAEHTEEGTIGFVLNRRLNITINELVEDLPLFHAPVFVGGPVEKNTLHYVHRLGHLLPGSQEIFEGLYWGGSFDRLKHLLNINKISREDILFFVGYSGWTERQLEEEIENKSWIVAPENKDFIFQPNYEDLWRNILKSMGTKYKVIANYPIDPKLN